MRYFWCELAIVSAFMITFAVEFNSLTIINIRTMVNYKDLGLVNTRDMFAKAIKGGYAIPAFRSSKISFKTSFWTSMTRPNTCSCKKRPKE
jgi:hypothetical protein